MSPLLRRSGALLASAGLAIAGVSLVSGPAQAAAADPRPVSIGATWLEGQLVDGLLPSQFAGFSDYGLSIDAGLSLKEITGHDATVAAIAAALAPKIATEYAQSDEYDFNPPYAFVQKGYYANPTAKSLVFAQAAGVNPTTWASINLVTATEDRVTTAGASQGRLADNSSFGDYGNSIGQAFAARGLTVAGSTKAADVTTFLLKQQCAAGFFRLAFTPTKDAVDQTCDGGTAAQSAPDTDVTALTVLQLKAIPSPSAAVTTAIGKATDWLVATQAPDGSFGGGPLTSTPNSNSTGLAGWALGKTGHLAEAADAATWVRARQSDELPGCASALITQTGAIGYNDAAVTAARTAGLPNLAVKDQWRRATAPTLPALAWAPARTANINVSGPVGYRKAGSTAIYQVTGIAPGAPVCLRAFGNGKQLIGSAAGTASGAFGLPATTGRAQVRVEDVSGNSASLQTLVLAAKTLSVASPSSAKQGSVVSVTIKGLAAAEHVKVTYRGVTVRTGLANSKGVFVASFNVGTKLGVDAVRAYGQYENRKGYDLLKVVK